MLDPHGSKKTWKLTDSRFCPGLGGMRSISDRHANNIHLHSCYNTIYIHRSSPTAKTPEQKQKVSGCESASVLLQVASLQLSDATSSASSLAASYSSSSPPSSSLLCKACRFPHQHLTISHHVVPSVSFRYPPVCLSAWANPVVSEDAKIAKGAVPRELLGSDTNLLVALPPEAKCHRSTGHCAAQLHQVASISSNSVSKGLEIPALSRNTLKNCLKLGMRVPTWRSAKDWFRKLCCKKKLGPNELV
jgi:hypothetical protein